MMPFPSIIGRREALKAGAAASSLSTPQLAQAQTQALTAPDAAMEVQGETFTLVAEANPLGTKIITFTTVSPDVGASIQFYRDVIGMTLHMYRAVQN